MWRQKWLKNYAIWIKQPWLQWKDITPSVVATTRPMSNSSTTSKSQGRYLVGNMSCVIHKRTQQGTTTVFYWLFI